MRNDPHALMIFAAGFGTRMAPLTDRVPKPLVQVAGRSLLDHALDPALAAGLGPIVVNAHYRADQIERALVNKPVTVCIEAPDILDTGGGLKAALPLLPGEAIFTMNSDAVWSGPNPYATLHAAWTQTEADALLLCAPMARAWGRSDPGDFTSAPNGSIERGPGWVYTGAQIIRRAAVEHVAEDVFSLGLVWDALIACGRIKAVEYPGSWCDVGRPSAIAAAEEMIGV